METEYSCIVWFKPGGFVKIEEDQVEIAMERDLTTHELAAVGMVNQAIATLKNGHFNNYEHKPEQWHNKDELVRCEWLRSGNLAIRGRTEKAYHLCATLEAAIAEPRSFTIPNHLLVLLPPNKGKFLCSKSANESSSPVPTG